MKDKVKFTVQMESELFNKLKEKAQKMGVTLSDLISYQLTHYFEVHTS